MRAYYIVRTRTASLAVFAPRSFIRNGRLHLGQPDRRVNCRCETRRVPGSGEFKSFGGQLQRSPSKFVDLYPLVTGRDELRLPTAKQRQSVRSEPNRGRIRINFAGDNQCNALYLRVAHD